ncbi:hypothetical protein ACP9M8_16345 [Pseudomonas aeruginosa]|uniref:hypothetical protein n=1 Tax=Pseudomonas aeruginosa TaxID=287 RepID=UPI003CEF19B8
MQQNENFAKQAEQAEAERPEVVAYRTIGRHTKHQHPHYALNYYKQNAEDQAAHWRERGCEVSEDELMTVAQHERIAASRWERAMDLMSEHVARISEKLTKERDAALARVAELEKQEPVGEVRESGGTLTAVIVRHSYATKLPVGTKLYAAPVAQAQRSVPEEFIGRLSEFLAQRGATGKALLRELRDMLAAAPGNSVPQAWLDVQAERRRQIEAEGWTPQHDDEHADGQMAQAAGCYALHAGGIGTDWPDGRQNGSALFWPWDKDWWKPTTPRRDLVKACALALTEIERLDRAGAPGKEVGHE